MRNTFRLLSLPICIAVSLAAQAADERPEEWRLCPIEEAVPVFSDAQPAAELPLIAGEASGDTTTTVPPEANGEPQAANAPAANAAPGTPGAQSDQTQVTIPPPQIPVSTPANAPGVSPETVTAPEARTDQPTDIESDQVAGTETKPQFQGNVALHRGDQFLGAKSLEYDTQTSNYVAQGDVRYQDSGMRLTAERAAGNQNNDTHEIQGVRYQLVARRGNGEAKHIDMHGAQGALYGASYSTCPPDARSWELSAQRIDVDTEAGTGVAHNAVLRVKNIPVLYVPWFPFPIDNRRRTGLLYPSIGLSDRNGFDYRQPIYLNLAPNYDLTLTPRIMTSRGIALGAQFRYLTENGRGVFDANYMPHDTLRDRDRGIFQFSGNQGLFPGWQARANLNWITDTRYLEDFSNSLYGLSPYSVTSTIGLYGNGRYWDAGLSASHYQLADYTLTESILPHDRLPRAWLNWEQPFSSWLSLGVNAEAVRFQHPTKQDGNRVDLKPYITAPLEGSSWFVTPTLAWRYTTYQLDHDYAASLGNDTDTPSRSLPIASLDAGLYFDRETSIGGQSYLNTLEPRLFYLRVPYRDQSGLPLFDTRPLTFSWGQLFRDNRYTGADRQTDANQLTLAVSSRLIRQTDGQEKLSASLGQIRYFDDSQVTVPGETPVERGKSAWVADTSYAVNDRWSFGASYQWDPKFRRKDLASIRTRYLIGDEGIVNLSYRYRRNLLEQTDLSFLYPLTPAWSVVGRYYYSLQDRQLLEGIAGLQWDSCCLAVRLVGRRYLQSRAGDLSNAIQVEFELKGLGSAGPDTETRLRRAILGYYREDLYLVPPSEVGDDADNSDDDSTTLPDPVP